MNGRDGLIWLKLGDRSSSHILVGGQVYFRSVFRVSSSEGDVEEGTREGISRNDKLFPKAGFAMMIFKKLERNYESYAKIDFEPRLSNNLGTL